MPAGELRIVPANQAGCRDLEAVFGTADYPFHCQCQRFKVAGWVWRDSTLDERLAMQRDATACGDPDAEHTSGLVAFARAAADHARVRGATAVEGYPMVTQPGVEITWGEVHVGAVQVFDDAGYVQVTAPTKRRRVMRMEFADEA